MEEEKAAAYYEELSRKGEGAARFKQGLGFPSSAPSVVSFPPKPSLLLSNFVRASSPAEIQKQAHLDTIQAKLKKNHSDRRGDREDCYTASSREDWQRERDREASSHRHGSRYREEERYGGRRGHRSPSVDEDDSYRRGKDMDRESPHRRRSHHRRSQSRSPLSSGESRHLDQDRSRKRERGSSPASPRHSSSKSKSNTIGYTQLIEGYSQMTPTERVKAKMKFQISQTAAKDTALGMRTGWERFDFNKDAPLDGDEDELEVAEDEASLSKVIGKSFRFSAAEAKHEEEVKSAHDHAMFGAPTASLVVPEIQSAKETYNEKNINDALISDKVLAMQRGSWRDRARRFQNSSRN